MQYKNIKTGAVINSACKIAGKNWIEVVTDSVEQEKEQEQQEEKPVDEKQEEKSVEQKQEQQEEKTGNADFDAITKKQIMQELDAFGIKYDPRNKKQELFDLMMQGK